MTSMPDSSGYPTACKELACKVYRRGVKADSGDTPCKRILKHSILNIGINLQRLQHTDFGEEYAEEGTMVIKVVRDKGKIKIVNISFAG